MDINEVTIEYLNTLTKDELNTLREEIASQPFIGPEEVSVLKAISNLLINLNRNSNIDIKDLKVGKFKKSKRVTNFSRNRE